MKSIRYTTFDAWGTTDELIKTKIKTAWKSEQYVISVVVYIRIIQNVCFVTSNQRLDAPRKNSSV